MTANILICPWKYIPKKAHVRYRNPYQTRHTYATQFLFGGEDPLFVAQQVGHKTTEMIMQHYGRRVDQGDQRQRHVYVAEFALGVEQSPSVSAPKSVPADSPTNPPVRSTKYTMP